MIKSVLVALPIYYMASSLIPERVIKKLNGLIMRFFWGVGDKTRYLTYVSRDTISKPMELGGLAVRDLSQVNESMLLKSL